MESKWNVGRGCEDNEKQAAGRDCEDKMGSQAYQDRLICHHFETKNHETFKT